jgi:hypothetical protein
MSYSTIDSTVLIPIFYVDFVNNNLLRLDVRTDSQTELDILNRIGRHRLYLLTCRCPVEIIWIYVALHVPLSVCLVLSRRLINVLTTLLRVVLM